MTPPLARLDQLRDLTMATWYARTQAIEEEAEASPTRVPSPLLERAQQIRERMMWVVAYPRNRRKDRAIDEVQPS